MRANRQGRAEGGSAMIPALIISVLIATFSMSWTFLLQHQEQAVSRRIGTKVARDSNAYGTEVLNQLLRSGLIVGYISQPPYANSTFWNATPSNGFGWNFTAGFPQNSGYVPLATMTVTACNAHQINMASLMTAFSPNPIAPAGCAGDPVNIGIPDAKSGAYMEILSNVTITQ